MELTYLPFPLVHQAPAIIVDSFHPSGLVLSHWRGAPTPNALREDTSGGIVLQAIKQQWPDLNGYQHVTANHFDIDAFVGVWALLNPKLAMAHEEVLRQMAVISDFRELDLAAPFAQQALKLVCWINAEEKARFYRPFGALELQENEARASVPKFEFFLKAFEAVLLCPENYRTVWEPEYQKVQAGYAQIHGPETSIKKYPETGFIRIYTPEPLHYYALFSVTQGYDIVLASYAGQRYELECKYTTWVDLASRPTLPRPDLRPLAAKLNALEDDQNYWQADGPTDTGPLLRINKKKLSKATRYAHPYERPMKASTLALPQLEKEVQHWLNKVYAEIIAKNRWSWPEIKDFNLKNTIL